MSLTSVNKNDLSYKMHLVWIARILSLTLLVSLLVPTLQAAITVRAGFPSVGRLKSQKEMFQIARHTSDKAPPLHLPPPSHLCLFALWSNTQTTCFIISTERYFPVRWRSTRALNKNTPGKLHTQSHLILFKWTVTVRCTKPHT